VVRLILGLNRRSPHVVLHFVLGSAPMNPCKRIYSEDTRSNSAKTKFEIFCDMDVKAWKQGIFTSRRARRPGANTIMCRYDTKSKPPEKFVSRHLYPKILYSFCAPGPTPIAEDSNGAIALLEHGHFISEPRLVLLLSSSSSVLFTLFFAMVFE
jgi:hypothetical protein